MGTNSWSSFGLAQQLPQLPMILSSMESSSISEDFAAACFGSTDPSVPTSVPRLLLPLLFVSAQDTNVRFAR